MRPVASLLALEPGLSPGFSLLAFIGLCSFDFIGGALPEHAHLLRQFVARIGALGFGPFAELSAHGVLVLANFEFVFTLNLNIAFKLLTGLFNGLFSSLELLLFCLHQGGLSQLGRLCL